MNDQLQDERAHLTRSRAALRTMRIRAEELFSVGDRVAGDAYTAEQLGRQMARRVKELADDPDTPLFFGKLTTADREIWHIGRRHVTEHTGEPLVLDWRAPLSRKFYQASAAAPQDVAVRRRFGFNRGELTSFEDEQLARGEELGTASTILTAEIERPRVGPMRDIVATIQPDQDELVRADLDTTICVQGAPGTGKTAVGLHRAAYLLYSHRERLRRSGVLVVGPNQGFLRYISAVLPALGEIEVQQATVDDLINHVQVTGSDSPATAALKHDPRLAIVLRDLLWGRIKDPDGHIAISDGSYKWRVDSGVLGKIISGVRDEQPPYSIGREWLRSRVVALLQRQAEARRAESPSDAWLRRMGGSKPVTDFLNHCWPAVKPEQVVAELLASPQHPLLTEAERSLLRRRGRKWTTADAVLIDEVTGLLQRTPSYGHIVIDEAQDLSPMQARALARRCSHGALTVLGDLAQGTAPWAAQHWADTLAHLGKSEAQVVPLTTGFRVPQAVLTLANQLLPALQVAVEPARSLRHDGNLSVRPVADLGTATQAAFNELLRLEGSIGVIAADATVGEAGRWVASSVTQDYHRVSIVPASAVKGLEFDHVIVVEPADIVAAEPRGLNRLYVALTRAVTSLIVVHAQPLPPALSR